MWTGAERLERREQRSERDLVGEPQQLTEWNVELNERESHELHRRKRVGDGLERSVDHRFDRRVEYEDRLEHQQQEQRHHRFQQQQHQQ